MAFWTYILRCSDGSYYVGHTDDIDYRMAQHERGAAGGYTVKRRPVSLLWSDQFPTRDEAFAAERKLRLEPRQERGAYRGRLAAGQSAGAKPAEVSCARGGRCAASFDKLRTSGVGCVLPPLMLSLSKHARQQSLTHKAACACPSGSA